MMTLKLTRTLRAALLAAAAIAMAGGSAVEAKTLRATSQLPASHPVTANLLEFAEKVKTASDGELEIQVFHSAQLYKDSEVPQAVASGAIDMGTASLTRFSGTIPAVDVFYVPFIFDGPDHVKKATAPDSSVRSLLDDAILETGARVLWWQAVGGAVLMSNTPLRQPSDVEGLKVRVFSKTLGDFVTAVGGTPALIAGSEQFLAYQRGTVDAGMSSAAGITSRKMYEVLDYVTVTDHADVEFVVIINEDVWKGLSDQERAWMVEVGQEVEKSLRDSIFQKDKDAIEFIGANTEMKVIELTLEERAAWAEASQPVVEQYLESSGELGKRVLEAVEGL